MLSCTDASHDFTSGREARPALLADQQALLLTRTSDILTRWWCADRDPTFVPAAAVFAGTLHRRYFRAMDLLVMTPRPPSTMSRT